MLRKALTSYPGDKSVNSRKITGFAYNVHKTFRSGGVISKSHEPEKSFERNSADTRQGWNFIERKCQATVKRSILSKFTSKLKDQIILRVLWVCLGIRKNICFEFFHILRTKCTHRLIFLNAHINCIQRLFFFLKVQLYAYLSVQVKT